MVKKKCNCWKVMENRLKEEGSELATNCSQLKLVAEDDGKRMRGGLK